MSEHLRTSYEKEVLKRAVFLWKQHKPCEFTHEQHLQNPTINATTDHEKMLFKACAELIKNSKKPSNTNKKGK
jgi:hypothetical protein